MNITIIGSGNVATVLGRKLLDAGHTVHNVSSRSADSPGLSSDIYIVAVADDHLRKVGEWLKLGDRLTVHTAGSVEMEVLQSSTSNYGVLYPLQSIRKELEYIPDIPLLIDANTEENRGKLFSLAHSISDVVVDASNEERKKLHLAAVITNNFTNHLYALTEAFCEKEGVEFSMLYPLLSETVRRLKDASPKNLQTGPAARNDFQTIEKQRDMLDAYPQLQKLYDFFTQSIINGSRS